MQLFTPKLKSMEITEVFNILERDIKYLQKEGISLFLAPMGPKHTYKTSVTRVVYKKPKYDPKFLDDYNPYQIMDEKNCLYSLTERLCLHNLFVKDYLGRFRPIFSQNKDGDLLYNLEDINHLNIAMVNLLPGDIRIANKSFSIKSVITKIERVDESPLRVFRVTYFNGNQVIVDYFPKYNLATHQTVLQR